MSVRPVTHSTWQVLRTAKRSQSPPTRQSKDGSFVNELVEAGLLARVSGSADRPFEATYALTALGEHAAEYGEYDHAAREPAEPPVGANAKPIAPKGRKRPK